MQTYTKIGCDNVCFRYHEGSNFFAQGRYALAMHLNELAKSKALSTQFRLIKFVSMQKDEDIPEPKTWSRFQTFTARVQIHPSNNLLACDSMHDARMFRGLTMMEIARLASQSVTQCTELLWQTAEKRKYIGEWDKVKEFEQNLRAVDDQKLAQIVEAELIRYMNLGGPGAEESRDRLRAFRKELKRK